MNTYMMEKYREVFAHAACFRAMRVQLITPLSLEEVLRLRGSAVEVERALQFWERVVETDLTEAYVRGDKRVMEKYAPLLDRLQQAYEAYAAAAVAEPVEDE